MDLYSFENPLPKEVENSIILGTSENMSELPDSSVHFVFTSPPYNVGKEFDQDYTLEEYLDFLRRVFQEVHRVLVFGGRVCINIGSIGRRPYIPLASYVNLLMIDLGFFMRGEVIWHKLKAGAKGIHFGTWLSAVNPVMFNCHEYILVFSKGRFKRDCPEGRRSTISKEDYMKYTESVLYVNTESAKRIGHPAPFPVELPRGFIELYTFSGEVVLDPFMGSGSTAIAALKTGRRFVGYEINEAYIRLANERIAREVPEATQLPLLSSDVL